MKQSCHFYAKTLVINLFIILFAFKSQVIAQKGKEVKGYGKASQISLPDNEFIKDWLILGPIGIKGNQEGKVDASAIKTAFDNDFLTSVSFNNEKNIEPFEYEGVKYKWKLCHSNSDIVSLHEFLGDTSYVICYALTEIISDGNKKALIGLGSDDEVKVWVNGKEVHKNMIPRAINIDSDIFEIDLKQGSNQVLIKIENEKLGYGFAFRALGKDILSDLLIQSSGTGDFDKVKKLIKYSPDLKKVNTVGLNAWQVATIKGRSEIAKYLENNGAEKTTNYPTLNEYIDRKLAPFYEKNDKPGITILVAENGNIKYEKGFGSANIKNKTLANPDTKFRIGSITKQFTAAAILRLQEQGKLSVSDKLSAYIPDFPNGNEVSIHHLLTHTSGIHNYTNRNDFEGNILKPTNDSIVLKMIESDTFDFNPGEQFSYCNSGYFILGQIITRITGKTLSKYFTDEFFIPLGMKNSGVYDNKNRPNNEAIGYIFDNGKIYKANDWDMSWTGGAGSVYSTVKDLFLWNEAIFNGKVLNESSLRMAFTPALLNNGKPTSPIFYGYGWMLSDYRGIKIIGHGGGLDGFISSLMRQPDEKLTIAVLMNVTPPYLNVDPESLSKELTEYLLWQKMSSQVTYSNDSTLTTDQLKAFTGSYDYGHGMILTINLDGKHLMAQMIGQPMFEIFYMGNNEFYWKVTEARIKFLKDDKGIVKGGIHYQGGQEINVSKL